MMHHRSLQLLFKNIRLCSTSFSSTVRTEMLCKPSDLHTIPDSTGIKIATFERYCKSRLENSNEKLLWIKFNLNVIVVTNQR